VLAITALISSLFPKSEDDTGFMNAVNSKSLSALIFAQNETYGLACLITS